MAQPGLSEDARPTIEDVARAAGVSTSSARNYFSRPAVLSASTHARIEQAVRATGYVPRSSVGRLGRRLDGYRRAVGIAGLPELVERQDDGEPALDQARRLLRRPEDERAVDMLAAKLRNPRFEAHALERPELIVRESTSPA